MRNSSKSKQILVIAVSVLYLFTVIYLTVIRSGLRRYDEHRYNLVPFVDLVDVYMNAGIGTFLYLFLGNIIWFIPFGFLLAVFLTKKRLLTVAACSFTFSLGIEVAQYITRKGIAETDDLILNVSGAVIGWSIYRLFARKKSSRKGRR